MKPSPAFQFYAQDFLVGTMLMTAEATGAYIKFLAYQWVNLGLPNDKAKCRQIAQCGDAALDEALAKFSLHEDGLLKNERLEVVRGEQDRFREKQRINGAKGGRPKSHVKPNANPTVNPNETSSPSSSSSNISSEVSEDEPKKKKREASDAGIEFAEWFRGSLPTDAKLEGDWKQKWGLAFDEMLRLDKRDPDRVYDVCEWARKDDFWKKNFMSPPKLRTRNKDGLQYFDVFLAKMPKPKGVPGTAGNPYL